MKKRQIVILAVAMIILVPIGIKLYLDTKVYSATDVLKEVDFNMVNAAMDIELVDEKAEKKFIPIEVPDTKQKELIEAFETADFEKARDVTDTTYDYRITFRLNRHYSMYLDSSKNYLILIENRPYTIKEGSDFFDILREIKD